ncbi:MAG TPA: diguanylate cyclase, partial [Rubrivivax sp.]|nr:diguanylate cyclase [Rubrivivax sp.]
MMTLPTAAGSANDLELVLRAPRVGDGGERRVRLAMYLAFLTLALAMLAQGWNALRLEALRAADAEITNRASLQGTFSQQIGRMAALIELSGADGATRARNTEALSGMLAQQGADALSMNELLNRQLAQTGDTRSNLRQALDSWEQQRERLWYRTELLLGHADAGVEETIRSSAAAVQAETGPALLAAQRLSDQLRAAANERAVGQRRQFQLGGIALLGLLALLAVVAVEPTARSVQRHARRLAEQATEMRRLAMVAEHTSALVVVGDRQHRALWVNEAFVKHTGFTLAEMVGRRPRDVLASPRADAQVLARVAQALEEGRGIREEWLNQTKDGRELWLDVDVRPLSDEQGDICGFVSVSSDVTARVQQQGKLQALWAVLPAGVMVHSLAGRLIEINRAAEKLLGMSLAQIQGREPAPHALRVLKEDGSPCPQAQYPSLLALATGQPLHNQTLGIRLPSGDIRWLLVNAEPQFEHGQVAGAITCMIDITERRLLQERLSDSARTDALTGLPNRTVVMQRLQQAVNHARRHPNYGFAVLFMDFDRFKQVNDTLGHDAGDELLRQIAQRLVQTLRPGDALARMGQDPDTDFSGQGGQVAARLGGDEFVVVLDGVSDAQTAGQIAQRLLEELAEPYLIGCNPVHSSASI